MANINLKHFPDDLHQRAKIKAAVDKTTLRQIIIQALREYLKASSKTTQRGTHGN